MTIHTFILQPKVLDLIEILAIVHAFKLIGVLVIQNTFSMELIVTPVTIVCGLIWTIVKHSSSVHFVFPELTLIKSTILESQFALTMLFALKSHSFISSTIFISLYRID